MNYYFVLAQILFCYMTCLFVLALLKKRNDIADIGWGVGFVMLAWSGGVLAEFTVRSLLVNTLVSVWGARLAWHIFLRNRQKPEDTRYQAWRKEGKFFYVRSYVQIFLLQGLLLYLVVLPVLFVNNSSFSGLSILDIIGLVIWLIGFYFESTADRQLKEFIADPLHKGKIMQKGLWRYSRHPNYFGEVTQWWGIFIITLSILFAVVTIIGPLTITTLILFVSGIPLLEKKYQGRKDFEDYKRQTSIFIPLPPRD